MPVDLTLTEDKDGGVKAHRPDCPEVERHRREGKPLCTMLGCQGPLPDRLRLHECLDEVL